MLSITLSKQDSGCATGAFVYGSEDSDTKERENQDMLVKIYKKAINLMERDRICYFLLENSARSDCRMLISNSCRTRARDMFDYLCHDLEILEEYIAKDHLSSWAYGRIPNAVNVNLAAMNRYLDVTEIVDAADYAVQNAALIPELPVYQKKSMPRAYAKTLDIAPRGTELILKTFENRSGTFIVADENAYIMIGVSGEAYDISKEKFDELYVENNDLSLQEYVSGFTGKTMCSAKCNGTDIDLTAYAHICLPKKRNIVYAKKLERMTKVFSVRKPKEYYLGLPGSYMTIDESDLTSIHIVEGDIFRKTFRLYS